MRRFTLPLIILASVAVAALLTWIAVSRATFGGVDAPTTRAPVQPVAATPSALPAFSRLDVSGTAEILLVQGAAESIAVGTDAENRRYVRVDHEVRDGTLYIEAIDDSRWWDLVLNRTGNKTAQIVVTFRDLSTIDAAGTVKLTAAALKTDALKVSGAGGTALRIDDLSARSLQLTGAGALRADLGGRVDDLAVTITGAGDFRGPRLVSQNAIVTVAGAGQVVVNAVKTLRADISGAGKVDYLGDPKVTDHVSGAGRVRRRDP